MMSNDCLFCKIINGDINGDIVEIEKGEEDNLELVKKDNKRYIRSKKIFSYT